MKNPISGLKKKLWKMPGNNILIIKCKNNISLEGVDAAKPMLRIHWNGIISIVVLDCYRRYYYPIGLSTTCPREHGTSWLTMMDSN